MRHDCVLAAQLESMSEGDDGAGIEESYPHSAVSTQPNRKTPTTEARRHGGKRVNKTLTTKVTQEHKGTPRKSGEKFLPQRTRRTQRNRKRQQLTAGFTRVIADQEIGKSVYHRGRRGKIAEIGNDKNLSPQRAQRNRGSG